MVDYFALIAPTIESLSKSTVEERRQVYDRLIKMLEAQLRSADPPRSEIDILRERIDLEAAIRRVERRIQAGQIAVGSPLSPDALKPVDEQMGLPPPPIGPKPKSLDPTPVPLPSAQNPESSSIDERVNSSHFESSGQQISPISAVAHQSPPALSAEPAEPSQAFGNPEPKPAAASSTARPTDWASLVPQPRPVDRIPAFSPRSTPRPSQAPEGPHSMSAETRNETYQQSVGDQQRRGALNAGESAYSDILAGPPRRPTGPPAAQSHLPPPLTPQAPRVPPQPVEPDASRAIYGQRGSDSRGPASRLSDLPAAFRSMPRAPGTRSPVSSQETADQSMPPIDPAVVDAGQALSQPMQPRRIKEPVSPSPSYRDPREFLRSQAKPRLTGKRRENLPDTPISDTTRPTVSVGERPRASMLPTRGSGGWKRLAIIAGSVIAILGGIATTAYLLRDDPAEFENAAGKYASSDKPQAEEKIADRLPTQSPQQNVTPAIPTAQKADISQQHGASLSAGPAAPTPDANGVLTQNAMLVMEPVDQSAPTPPIIGRVTWKLETLKSVVANASEIGSRATVDIPEVGLSAAFVFRRNRDPQSANSHMIEVTFTLAENNSTGKVRDIRVPELRVDEVSRGTPLSGIPVPVTENVFLVGLNALPSEMQKNLDLLRSQNWFAMPLRFANGKRGFLMFEKGKTGERVMEDAMQAWKAN